MADDLVGHFEASAVPGDMVDLYHHTYPESAESIYRDRRFEPGTDEDRVYFTNLPSGGSGEDDYGSGVVHLRMPRHLVNDWGPDAHGEHYYDADPDDIRPEHFVESGAQPHEAARRPGDEDLESLAPETHYHISPHRLEPGTTLRAAPAGEGNFNDHDPDYVYFTEYPHRLRQFRDHMFKKHPELHVYEVEPHGEVEDDPNDDESYRSYDPVTVTRHIRTIRREAAHRPGRGEKTCACCKGEGAHHDFPDDREQHTASVATVSAAAEGDLLGHFEAAAPSVTERAPALSHDGPDDPPADGDGGWGGGGGGKNRFTVIRNGPNYGLVNDAEYHRGSYVGYHASMEDALHHLAHMKHEGTFDPSEVRYAGKTDYKRTRDITPEFHNHYARWFEPKSAAYKPHADVIGAPADMSEGELAEHAKTWHANLPLDQAKRHAKTPRRQHEADHRANQGASFDRGAHADACPSSWGGWVHHAGNCAYRGPSGHEHAPSMKDMFPSGSDDLLGHFEASEPSDALEDVRKRGYCTDEWDRWQQGQCGTYACGLMKMKPGLRFGVAGDEHMPDSHFFAHDDTHAYDSAGRHPLPYRGVHGDLTHNELDSDPDDYGLPDDEAGPEDPQQNVVEAQDHARRNRILDGGFSATAARRPGRGEKSCACCHGEGSHPDGSECDPCDGSGMMHSSDPDVFCPGQPQPKRRHWRQASMPQPDYDPADPLPAGKGIYYRAHLKGAPLDEQHARSRPLKSDGGKDETVGLRGYSAWRNPHDLAAYMHAWGWSRNTEEVGFGDRHVVAFHGREVGRGRDREPLVAPVASPGCCGRVVHSETSWPEFDAEMRRRAEPLPQYQTYEDQIYSGHRPDGSRLPWDPAVDSPVEKSVKRHERRHGREGGKNYPPAERHESVRHMLDHYRPYDFDTWDEVRDNNVWDHPKMRAFVDDIRRNGVQRPIPVDYEQDPPQVRNGHTRLLAAERAGVEMVPTRQHPGWLDPDDPGNEDLEPEPKGGPGSLQHEIDRIRGGHTAALEVPAGSVDEPSNDYKEIRVEAAGTIDLYHHTSPEAAAKIYREKRMTSKENVGSIFFTTDPESEYAAGFGDGVVHVRMPRAHLEALDERGKAWQDDEFPSGEQHWAIHHSGLRPEHFVDPSVGSREAAGPEDYGMDHRPDMDGPPLHDLTGDGMLPADFYDNIHDYTRAYEADDSYGIHNTISKVRRYRGQPDKMVTIWRGAPATNPESRNGKTGEINQGDWIGLDRQKAVMEARQVNDPPSGSLPANHPNRYHVWSARVPARHVRNSGGDLTEWGYAGPDLKGIPHVSETCSHRARVKPEQREAAIQAEAATEAPEGHEIWAEPHSVSPVAPYLYHNMSTREPEDWYKGLEYHGPYHIVRHPQTRQAWLVDREGRDANPMGGHFGNRERDGNYGESVAEGHWHGLESAGPDAHRIGTTEDPKFAIMKERTPAFPHSRVDPEDVERVKRPAARVFAPEGSSPDDEYHGSYEVVRHLYSPEEMAQHEGPGWTPHHESSELVGRDGTKRYNVWERDASPDLLRERGADFYKNFAAYREHAGGRENPLFFSTDTKAFAAKDPSHFAIVHARPRPGAMGHQVSALGEWRTGTGDAIETHRAERMEGDHLKEAALAVTGGYDWETDEGPFTWEEIGDRHPHVYGEDSGDSEWIGGAAAHLAYDRPGHSFDAGEEDRTSDDLEFHPSTVDPSRIDYMRSEPGDPRVSRARQGYESQRPERVPPVVLVHRHGVFQVADGHHRAEGAAKTHRPVRAYVAYSPHEDEPFADGEHGPFHGAETEERPAMRDQNGIPRRISYPGFPHTAEVPRPTSHEASLEATAVSEEECPHCGGPAHGNPLVFGDYCPGEADESWQDDAGRGLTRPYVAEPTDEDALRSHMVSHGPRWDNPAAPADWLSQVHNRLHSHGEGVFHQHDLPGGGHDPVLGSAQARTLVSHFTPQPVIYADVHDQVPALPAARPGLFAWPGLDVPEDPKGLAEALYEMPALVGVIREELHALAVRLSDESPLHPSVVDMIFEMAASCRTAQEDMGRLAISSPEGSWEAPGSGPKA